MSPSLSSSSLVAISAPEVILQVGGSSLVVIGASILGAIAILLRAASTHFAPQDDEEEDHIEVATGDSSGGGRHHSSLEDTITAEVTADPGAGDIKVSRGPIEESHGPANKVKSVSTRNATQCSHCGAVNKEGGSLCWNCGSNPDAALNDDELSTINDRLRKGSTDDSYVVRKGEEPQPHPVETAATPQGNSDRFESSDGTTEKDIRDREQPPIWRVWVGGFIGWIEKWQTLIGVHARSMVLVTLIAAVFWGISLVYGAMRFGASGFTALLGATIIAVCSASVAALFFLAPGKWKTVGLAYPFSFNVILLPPLIIAYYEPILSFVWAYSTNTAIFILDTVFAFNNINTFLRRNFTMTNGLYIAMWFFLAYPIGWAVGSSVYLSRAYGVALIIPIKRLFFGANDDVDFDAVPDDISTNSSTDENNPSEN